MNSIWNLISDLVTIAMFAKRNNIAVNYPVTSHRASEPAKRVPCHSQLPTLKELL